MPRSFAILAGGLRLLARISPSLAGRAAADLFMTPRRFDRPAREDELLASATPFAIPFQGTLQAWRWGSGSPVLLLHGWEGRGAQLAQVVPRLTAAGHSVVAFDAPGHGLSTGKRSSLPEFAAALQEVARVTGAPHAVVAHSLGCAATTLAIRDGLRASRLVYFAPPLEPIDYTVRFCNAFGLNGEVALQLQRSIAKKFQRKWSDYSLADAAPTMSTPLLVIHDRDDEDTYLSEGAALAATWPGARLLTTEGLGHRRILRDPATVEAAVRFILGEG
jgi:pimeloyl-ACP methyl ester carboxylesterase